MGAHRWVTAEDVGQLSTLLGSAVLLGFSRERGRTEMAKTDKTRGKEKEEEGRSAAL